MQTFRQGEATSRDREAHIMKRISLGAAYHGQQAQSLLFQRR